MNDHMVMLKMNAAQVYYDKADVHFRESLLHRTGSKAGQRAWARYQYQMAQGDRIFAAIQF